MKCDGCDEDMGTSEYFLNYGFCEKCREKKGGNHVEEEK